ncbi:MAG: dihydrofolate reductase family protein [Pseudomonadota bacterium]
MPNFVFIATSLDGYISAPDGGLDWLDAVPATDGDDGGFSAFMARVDLVVMGRITFDTVEGFGSGWPYPKPGLILSRTRNTAPDAFKDHVQFAQGAPQDIVATARARGFQNLYIDGGKTIRDFLDADLIDEMILTEFPILLGGGTRLFDRLEHSLSFDLLGSETLRGQLLQKHYRRRRG